MSDSGTPRRRTTVVRVPHRGHYDRATIDAILDEGFVCHIAFVVDDQPYAMPRTYGPAMKSSSTDPRRAE
jgi:uncharacterized protein